MFEKLPVVGWVGGFWKGLDRVLLITRAMSATTKTYQLLFSECEHDGDLSMYADAVAKYGRVTYREGRMVKAEMTPAQLNAWKQDDLAGFCDRIIAK